MQATTLIRIPLTRAECGARAMTARLTSENWDDMTQAANDSPNHVKSMDRWRRKARESNPALDDQQVDRLAQRLRGEYYSRLGKLSAQKRRIARDIARPAAKDA